MTLPRSSDAPLEPLDPIFLSDTPNTLGRNSPGNLGFGCEALLRCVLYEHWRYWLLFSFKGVILPDPNLVLSLPLAPEPFEPEALVECAEDHRVASGVRVTAAHCSILPFNKRPMADEDPRHVPRRDRSLSLTNRNLGVRRPSTCVGTRAKPVPQPSKKAPVS